MCLSSRSVAVLRRVLHRRKGRAGGNSSISNVRIKPGGDIFQVAQEAGAGGLAFIRVKGDELETIGAIKNNLTEQHIADILKITEAKDGDLILLGAGDKQIVNQSLDRVRQYIAKELNLIDKSKWNFLWVTDFPMFERNEDENRYEALHHPFCSPKNIKSKDSENLKKEIESQLRITTYKVENARRHRKGRRIAQLRKVLYFTLASFIDK